MFLKILEFVLLVILLGKLCLFLWDIFTTKYNLCRFSKVELGVQTGLSILPWFGSHKSTSNEACMDQCKFHPVGYTLSFNNLSTPFQFRLRFLVPDASSLHVITVTISIWQSTDHDGLGKWAIQSQSEKDGGLVLNNTKQILGKLKEKLSVYCKCFSHPLK